MLKNYTVIIKNVKIGQQDKIIKYLENETHKNHMNTKIICENEVEIFRESLLDKLHENNKNYIRNKKGGRPPKRVAKSLTFNIPPVYKATEEQSKEISKELILRLLELFKSFNIELDEQDLFMAIHYQDNPHIHLLLPVFNRLGVNIRRFNFPSFTTQLKLIFTESVDKILKTDIAEIPTLTEEEQAHNQTIRELKALKDEYIKALEVDIPAGAKKYINNELITIERSLKADKIELKYLNKLNAGADKITKADNKLTISTKITTL